MPPLNQLWFTQIINITIMLQDIHPHQFSNKFMAGNTITDSDYLLHYKDSALLLRSESESFALPQKKDVPVLLEQSKCIFLFTLNNSNCYLVDDIPGIDHPDFGYHDISFFRTINQKEIAWIATVGYQLKTWYEQNQFCGKCGSKMMTKADERAVVCPACKTIVYPRISPAVIVAIRCANKILLAKGVDPRFKFHSLIAGFTEIGETLEQTVVREVKEEVGVDVKNIRYYKSQPWPFSGSMMIGFVAEADDRQPIVIDPNEISHAAWFTRDDLPNYPQNISIAGEMIGKFIEGEI